MASHRLGQPGPKPLNEGVFGRDKGLGRPRITLPGAAADKLAIDAGRIMAFGENNVQSAAQGDARAEPDVRAAPRQVGGNRDGARLTSPCHDPGLRRVLSPVQHREFQFSPTEQLRQLFAVLDAARANQYRPPQRVDLPNAPGNRLPLGRRIGEEPRRQDLPAGRYAQGNRLDSKAVHLAELPLAA